MIELKPVECKKIIEHCSKIALEQLQLNDGQYVIISIRSLGGAGANLSHLKNNSIYRFAFDDDNKPISKRNCNKILNILRSNSKIIVQCEAGYSRSAAICKFAQEYLSFIWVNEGDFNMPNQTLFKTLKTFFNEISTEPKL